MDKVELRDQALKQLRRILEGREVQEVKPRESHERRYSFGGKDLTLTEWAREVGIERSTLRGRLERGWGLEKTLTQPVKDTG